MKKLILFSIILPSLLIIAQNFDGEYPAWFLFPSENTNVHIGFSYKGYSAKDDVMSMTSLFNECIVTGTLNLYSMEQSEEMFKDSDYYYYFDPDKKVVDENKLFPLKRFNINFIYGTYIQAYASDSSYILCEKEVSLSEIPEWTKKTYFEDGTYFYGVGMYTSTGQKIDAWKTSEEKGIFNIILNNAVQVYRIQISEDDYGDNFVYDEIISYKIRYRLRDIETLERYPDYDNELFYTLVRIKKENVLAAF